jgi:hypothetical protein
MKQSGAAAAVGFNNKAEYPFVLSAWHNAIKTQIAVNTGHLNPTEAKNPQTEERGGGFVAKAGAKPDLLITDIAFQKKQKRIKIRLKSYDEPTYFTNI